MNPAAVLAPDTTVPALLEARIAQSPDDDFLIWDRRRWTYREAGEEALKFSGWLESLGEAGAGSRVASFLGNCPEAIWTWFGTLCAGATFVPLNRAHRGDLLADMIERSEARVLVTDQAGLADLPDLSGTHIQTVLLADGLGAGSSKLDGQEFWSWSEVRSQDVAAPRQVKPTDLAELMYSSGTTGRSKAVRLSHGQICRGAGWVVWSLGMSDRDVFHGWLPLFHIAGQVDMVLNSLIAGGSVALFPGFSLSRFWDQVGETGATIFIGFSNVLQLLCSLPTRGEDAATSLRCGIGGAVPADLSREFTERFDVRLHDCYGMTEAEPMILPPAGTVVPAGSCGLPSPDFEAAIFDGDGNPVDPGTVGEICVRPRRSAVLTTGYEGDDKATLEATRDLWFRTGDLARTDENGFYFFVDRIKHSIRKGGESISSWELENLIVAHPLVNECAAIGVESRLRGDEVKVSVVVENGANLEPADLHSWCLERMAGFMIPRYIELLDALPRADTGKVMKEELRSITDDVWDAGERTARRQNLGK